VAFFKQAAIVGKLRRTRSGKILRGPRFRKIADGIDYAMRPPSRIRPRSRDERLLSRLGYARKP